MVRFISVRELNSMCTGCFEAAHAFWRPVITFRDPHTRVSGVAERGN